LIADIALLVLACLALPFSGALVVRCIMNVAIDTMSVVFTALQLDAQIDDDERIADLINLFVAFKNRCTIYYSDISKKYKNIVSYLAAYKNARSPGERVSNSTLTVQNNKAFVDLVSENC
jgi:hypothetical protein